MQNIKVIEHITEWLKNYADDSNQKGYIIGISGGIDSALTSTLCALTGLDVLIVSLPLRQRNDEYKRAHNHITYLANTFNNVKSLDIDLTKCKKAIVKLKKQFRITIKNFNLKRKS